MYVSVIYQLTGLGVVSSDIPDSSEFVLRGVYCDVCVSDISTYWFRCSFL